MPSLRSAARKPRPRPTVQFENGNQLNSTLGIVGVILLPSYPSLTETSIIVTLDRQITNVSTDNSCFTLINDAGDEFNPGSFGPQDAEFFRNYWITFDLIVTGFVVAIRVNDEPDVIVGTDGSTLPSGLTIPLTARFPEP